MNLLCLLASEPGKVFSKQELFDRVWGLEVVEDVTLSRCVSDLRRALGDDARAPRYIETLPKRGYRLIAGLDSAEEPGSGPREDRSGFPWAVVISGLVGALIVMAIGGVWLTSRLSDGESTDDPPISAYDYYLQGREHYRQYRRVENEKAIELFRKSVEVDPSFALGHAELANALVIQQGNYGVPGDWVAQATPPAQRALELQPDLPEAHKAIGHIYSVREQYSNARSSFERALELRPDYRDAQFGVALTSYLLGDYIRGLEGFKKVHATGFSSAVSIQHVGWILWRLGLFDEAEMHFRRALEIEAHHMGGRKGLAWVSFSRGEFEEARRRYRELLDVHPECSNCLMLAGDIELEAARYEDAGRLYQRASDLRDGRYIYANLRLGQLADRRGDPEAGDLLLSVIDDSYGVIQEGIDDPVWPWMIAAAQALLGEHDSAVENFEKAIDLGHRHWDIDDPALESVSEDPRYRRALQKSRERLVGEQKAAIELI